GPILPLSAPAVGTDQLLGGPGSRPAAVDALAARTLVKGEPLAPPAGRADDFAWPRREVGREQAKGDTPVANVAPGGAVSGNPAQRQPQPQRLQPAQPGQIQPGQAQPGLAQPGQPGQLLQPQRPQQQRPAQNTAPSLRDMFGGFGSPAPAPRQ